MNQNSEDNQDVPSVSIEQPESVPFPSLSQTAQQLETSATPLTTTSPAAASVVDIDSVHMLPLPEEWTNQLVSPALMRFKLSWEAFVDSLMREWKTLNVVSALLLSAILTMFQVPDMATDPLTRTAALLSLICAIMSLSYGCMYIVRFGTMRSMCRASRWAETSPTPYQEAQKTKTLLWWNVWILLAMPAVWMSWSMIFFIFSIISYVWRTGSILDPQEREGLSPKAVLGPRIAITGLFVLGMGYFVLIVKTLRAYGDDGPGRQIGAGGGGGSGGGDVIVNGRGTYPSRGPDHGTQRSGMEDINRGLILVKDVDGSRVSPVGTAFSPILRLLPPHPEMTDEPPSQNFSLFTSLTSSRVPNVQEYPVAELIKHLIVAVGYEVCSPAYQRFTLSSYYFLSLSRDLRDTINGLIQKVETSPDEDAWISFDEYTDLIDPTEDALLNFLSVIEREQWAKKRTELREVLRVITKHSESEWLENETEGAFEHKQSKRQEVSFQDFYPRYLIDTQTFELADITESTTVSQYAILSHRWIEGEEVSFREFRKLGEETKSKSGHCKIYAACQQAKKDGFRYIWIDTCCIDNENSDDVARNIKSMYAYYRNASVCYAYLVDVHSWRRESFKNSEWFNRGWTLQELVAPYEVKFFDRDWDYIGSKDAFKDVIEDVTGIPSKVLSGEISVQDVGILERMSWALGRTTTKLQDRAYCLQGLLGVSIEPDYNEDISSAFNRLRIALEAHPEYKTLSSDMHLCREIIHKFLYVSAEK
ncbi:hypothetical protein VKT23_009490 [Stygiomarasmius scandens]|uniref:Heterokaryon incompatibility domain-containing protein n=1 Tax=Marasmiellus scandens TaxID=2682957 RepID=A0ABR1JEQ4_9AGAR